MSDAPIFEIKKAVRRGVPSLIALWGPSNCGKTFTALHIARGLVGPQGKIGMVDTENGRALFYSDVAGGFDHIDLQPPFNPERYTAALETFEQVPGYGCIIVDSASHAWEGEGGVLEIADKTAGHGLQKWKAPKTSYRRMVNSLLRANCHVIFCLRVKDGVKQTGSGSSAKIEQVGAQPIFGKGFISEMTISALLGPDHCPVFPGDSASIKCDPLIPSIKAPEALKEIFQPGQPLGVDAGKRIAAWTSGGTSFDVDAAKIQREARNVACMGAAKLEAYWKGLPKPAQHALLPIKEELKSIAADADLQVANEDPAPYDTETGEMRL